MTAVTVRINNSALRDLVESRVTKGLRATGLEALSLMQSIMRESVATGNLYGNHRASSAGQPPAIDTGRLIGSGFATGVERQGGDLVASAGFNAEYALGLENGTDKVAARPFIKPAVFNNRERLLAVFKAFAQ